MMESIPEDLVKKIADAIGKIQISDTRMFVYSELSGNNYHLSRDCSERIARVAAQTTIAWFEFKE